MIGKLGKLPAREDSRTLKLGKYLDLPALPPIPAVYAYAPGLLSCGMMLNDTISDCTIATAGHMIQVWSLTASGNMITIPDSAVLEAYCAISGYEPGKPDMAPNGGGCYILDVLNYWRQVGIDGHKILAYAKLDASNRAEVNTAIYLFGGTFTGLLLPKSAQGEPTWYVPDGGLVGDGAPGSWGGHAVTASEYAEWGRVYKTWGITQPAQCEFEEGCCDEQYAIVAPEFFKDGKTPLGFDLDAMLADLQVVTSR